MGNKLLVGVNVVHADAGEVVYGRSQANSSAILGVPASNFQGRSFQVEPSRVTRRIMSPPPMKGGMVSSSRRLPYRMPMPVDRTFCGQRRS